MLPGHLKTKNGGKPLMGAVNFCSAHPFCRYRKGMKTIKKLAILSGVCAVIYSVIKIEKITQIWVLPIAF